MNWIQKVSIRIPVWSPGTGYHINDPYFRAIIPLLSHFNLPAMKDGETAVSSGWKITKGTDEYGRSVITYIEKETM